MNEKLDLLKEQIEKMEQQRKTLIKNANNQVEACSTDGETFKTLKEEEHTL